MFKKVNPKQSFPEMEEEILKFWQENKIFEKSLEKTKGKKPYVFYDGPPFATGRPHYGHIVASAMKDAVPRYWTMRGRYVERVWGWDCHGLPIENIAEKELGIKRKTEIEAMGVEKFNEFCRSKVLDYVAEWKKIIARFGRWVDMENAYKTMDLSYMESVWWVFKELYKSGLIYEGYRSMHICPRCETTLSQQEVAEGYKDIADISLTAKFKLLANDEQMKANENEYILAWTTTPWTLIGNVALAINEKIVYVKIKKSKIKNQNDKTKLKNDEFYILAKERLNEILKDDNYEIVSEFKGKDLVGREYEPLFDYYLKENLENAINGWKIYPADFVTTEEGTGIVHIAPAFGEDDLQLGQKHKLPFIQHVGMDGRIRSQAADFAGCSVKPAGNHQATDIEIIKFLAGKNLLFAKEKYIHSYPHCWRCDTPLINYATSSWFVSVEKIKKKALALAKKINWSPSHIKIGRFGNWLEGARDWSISRQRYWASVIPIWKCQCGNLKVIGSIEEIKEHLGSPNKLYLVRHGEAENNVAGILNSDLRNNHYHLTPKGKVRINNLANFLKEEKIDLIYASPFLRTKETAEIISKKTKAKIRYDERIRELQIGRFEGKTLEEFYAVFPNWPDEKQSKRENYEIESEVVVEKRLRSFLNEINARHQNKKIVIVSHGDPLQFFFNLMQGVNRVKAYQDWYPAKGSLKIAYSKPVDLHKHFIDKIFFKCEKCQGRMKRIPDVLDTWFDSGSMPYAQLHYPFENKKKFEDGFPAEFIAEGVDQTRAWFYYLHIIATAIKKSRAYNNVIVNGIVTGEDGKKLSKRLENYPDPMEIFEKYGADSLRFYLLSSPVTAAENLKFKELDVADVARGMMRMLWNSYFFFTLYANIDGFQPAKKQRSKARNLLDRWIISELNVLTQSVNSAMEKYELNSACRLFPKFIDNLSNWHIRRSRKRFWKSENDVDKKEAYQTLYTVLVELSKLLAPFTPFIAEEIYKNLTNKESARESDFREASESVHLAKYPKADKKLIDKKLNLEMSRAREIVSAGLQLRAQAKIKVRQPLAALKIKNQKLKIKKELIEIIKDEVNVKKVIFDNSIAKEIEIDARISKELKLEGQARDIIRFIQEMRKEAGYEVDNRIKIGYAGGLEVFQKFGEMIKKEVLGNILCADRLDEVDLEREIEIHGEIIKIQIKKEE